MVEPGTAKVMLTQSEILPLGVLMMVPGQALERRQIIANLVDETDTISDASLEVRMTHLRRKISEVGGAAPAIMAVRNAGYKLTVPMVMESTMLKPRPVSGRHPPTARRPVRPSATVIF